jgi:hypothetical protein
MFKEASARDPIWPEAMPGADGIADGRSAPTPAEQSGSTEEPAGAVA